MLDLSTKELKAIAEIRDIKGYKSMSEDELLGALTSSKPVKKSEKPKTNFSKVRIEKVIKEFNESRHKPSKSKIKEIRKIFMKLNTKRIFLNQR